MKLSVITPTWRRHGLLLGRAVPSVAQQTYPDVEHVVVSDGPDPTLRALLGAYGVVYGELDTHPEVEGNWGSYARNHGLDLATGDLICYLDDDNAFRPDHAARLAAAFEANPDADFAYTQMRTHPHEHVIGAAPPGYGQIDSSVLAHRREVPDRFGRWPLPAEMPVWSSDLHAPDWAVVNRWLSGGARWVFVDQVTVDYYFTAGNGTAGGAAGGGRP